MKTTILCVLAACCLLFGREAAAQGCGPFKMLDSPGQAGAELGRSVTVSGDRLIAGAWLADDRGSLAGAAVVFRCDGLGWIEEQRLVASDGKPFDFFGWSVALSGDVAVVGAVSAGAAYVFRRTGASWIEEARLTAFDGVTSHHFGDSVAISGDVIVVGEDQDDPSGTWSGSAYVFRYRLGQWIPERHLTAFDGHSYAHFGSEVAVDGDVAVIGAYLSDSVDGPSSGAAYVFRFEDGGWNDEQKLAAGDGEVWAFFGAGVAVSGEHIVCGARWKDVVIGGRLMQDVGAAYVFRFDGRGWAKTQQLLDPAPVIGDGFGYSVALWDVDLAVGVPNRDDFGAHSGAVQVFRRDGARFVHDRKLLAPDGRPDDRFGESVAVSERWIGIGEPLDDDNLGKAAVFLADLADRAVLLGAEPPG